MLSTKRLSLIVSVMAVFGATSAVAGITSTKHNLSASGTGTIHSNAGQNNDELCVYCHTPHAANVDFVGAPLWNKGTPTGTFQMYGSTIAGTTTDAAPNNPSKACLSCHDGVSAINSIVNAPGSGGYNATGANVAFAATTAGTAFTMPAGVTQIGTDLRNDHPVSIVFTPGRASLKVTTATLTGWVGASKISDVLRGAGNDRVECGSCHDPHSSVNQTFLRADNTGSALCLGCHDK